MPVFRIQTPSGQILKIEAATKEQAIAGARETVEGRVRSDARRFVGSTPAPVRMFTQGASAGWSDELNARGAQLTTGAGSLAAKVGIGRGSPYSGQQAYDAVMDEERAQNKAFRKDNPGAAVALEIGGAVAGLLAAPAMTAARRLPVALRAIGGGGLLGGLAGAGAADRGKRVQGAQSGAMIGAAAGAAIPVAAKVIGATGGAVGRAADRATGGGLTRAGNAVQRAVGREPVQRSRVSERLARALESDGATPDQIRTALNTWMKTGASSPAFMDVIRKLPRGGESTLGLVRGATLKAGPARSTIQTYQDEIEANLQPRVIDRTRQMAGNPASPAVARRGVEEGRSQRARENYAGPYATERPVTPEMVAPLRDQEGAEAIQRAVQGARGMMDYPAVADLEALLKAAKDPNFAGGGVTTGRALDRVQQAFGATGRGLAGRDGARDLAAGQFHRQGLINQSLDSIEGLKPARGDYRASSQELEAIDLGSGANIDVGAVFTNPRAYVERLRELGAPVEAGGQTFIPRAREMAGVGLTDDMISKIGAPADNATGFLNKIATGTNTGQVLGETFGQGAAGSYRSAVQNEIDRLINARAANPNMGSQTAGRLIDERLVEPPQIPTGIGQGVQWAADRLNDANRLGDDERDELVRMAIAPARETLEGLGPEIERILRARMAQQVGTQAGSMQAGSMSGR